MGKEQPSRGIALENLHSIRKTSLWLTGHKKVNVVGHNLHRVYGDFKVLCGCKQMRLDFIRKRGKKNLLSVFGTPYDVILERIHIPATMRYVLNNTIRKYFFHTAIIPYA